MIRRDFVKLGMATALTSGVVRAVETSGEFKPIKIAQIGVRHGHASAKMESLRKMTKYFDVVGIAAESPKDENEHRKDKVYAGLEWTSQEELLKTPGLEAVAVETELDRLMATATCCARHGKHMHVDKPLGLNLEECKTMLDACRANNVIMQPGYMYRTNQAMRLLLKAIRRGWLGEVHDISGDMCRNDTSPTFRKFRARYRGGGMYFFGSHLLDFIVEAMGEPEDVRVFERPDPKDSLQDNTLSVLIYKRAICEVRVSMRKIDGNATRRLTAFGTKGSFVLDPLENWTCDKTTKKPLPLEVRLTLAESNDEYKAGVHKIKLDPCADRYVGQLTDLAMYIRGMKKNPYTLDDELLSQRVILAASGCMKWEQ